MVRVVVPQAKNSVLSKEISLGYRTIHTAWKRTLWERYRIMATMVIHRSNSSFGLPVSPWFDRLDTWYIHVVIGMPVKPTHNRKEACVDARLVPTLFI